ncbi:MAG: hypothetical protein PHU04_02475 [Candidatus Peribacteraceae bacterium]|nr:hypothetical protein [Candidatus Peribacteraceae bacterium]
MKQYHSFIFDSYAFDRSSGKVELHYALDDEVRFTETLTLPEPIEYAGDEDALDRALFLLHLFGGISYFKTCCPKTIEVRSGTLTKEQAAFWNTVYTKGLGQFFFENKVDFRGLINFPATSEESSAIAATEKNGTAGTLVPVGGGKDSVVTVEKLKKEGRTMTLFRMGSHPIIDQIAKTADLPLLTVRRQLSQKLFALNEEGALNGHVPITGYLSALTIVISELYGFDAVAMSNEKSASEGNTEYMGEEINHQWSKGKEFETMFREYLKRFVTKSIRYENPLRDMTELEIAKEFTGYPRYFPLITSCNKNWKILKEKEGRGAATKPNAGGAGGAWCGDCPKCAFVFALFAAHLPKDTVEKMFRKNLFADAGLLPLYRELLGIEGCKPFECIGTAEETQEAFRLAHEQGAYEDTPAMQLYLSTK